jgi:YesN/AraC family two-component response regulator
MIRAGLAATIGPESDMTVVGEAATGEEGLEFIPAAPARYHADRP